MQGSPCFNVTQFFFLNHGHGICVYIAFLDYNVALINTQIVFIHILHEQVHTIQSDFAKPLL